MSSTDNAQDVFKIVVDKIVQDCGRQVVSRGTRVVNALRNAELDVLKGQRSGKIYRKPHTKKATYKASAPGEAPARRTGALRLSWTGEVSGDNSSGNEAKITAVLQSNQKYSGYLEDGTPRMDARPYKDKIIEKATPEIKAIYNEPYS